MDGESGKSGVSESGGGLEKPHVPGDSVPDAAGRCLSLIIPAWNEKDTIAQAIAEADSALSQTCRDYEIIVVDDGSRDETAEMVARAAGGNGRVRLVRHGRNRGYGAAIRSGFQAAQHDLVAFTDADCQFDLRDLEYMLPLTGKYDIVCGYRMERKDPASRRFFSWGYNTLVKLLLETPVQDIDCALKIFHRSQVAGILPECNDFFVNTEMLTRARAAGLTVVEVGVHHRPRAGGESKVSWKDVPKTLSKLMPFWWARWFPGTDPGPERLGPRVWLAILLLALGGAFLLFHNLSYRLMEPDEGRYAEISREMLARGDYVVPTLNQSPYLDKPPLFYWLVGGTLRLFGPQDWAARLVPALATFLTILVIFFFGRRLVGVRPALWGTMVFTLMLGVILCGRILIFDSVLTLLVGLSLFMGYLAVQGSRLRWGWWLGSAIFCALGCMLKGPVALVLFAPPLAAYAWFNRNPARPRFRHWLAYVLVVTAIVLPWFIIIMQRCPDFAYYFFVYHHLVRFFGNEHHSNSILFYVPVILLGCMPWSLLLIPLGGLLLNRGRAERNWRTPATGFLVLWEAWMLLFFSLSNGKLPPYILPATPALALLLGRLLDTLFFQKEWKTAFRWTRTWAPVHTVMVMAAVWMGFIAWSWLKDLTPRSRLPLEMGEMIFCLAVILGVLAAQKKNWLRGSWALCGGLALCLFLELADGFLPAYSIRQSPFNRGPEVEALLRRPNTGVVCLGQEWGSIPFYWGHDDRFCHIKTHTSTEVTQFISQHERTVLFSTEECPLEEARKLVPPGRKITHFFNSGKFRIFLIQTQCERISQVTVPRW